MLRCSVVGAILYFHIFNRSKPWTLNGRFFCENILIGAANLRPDRGIAAPFEFGARFAEGAFNNSLCPMACPMLPYGFPYVALSLATATDLNRTGQCEAALVSGNLFSSVELRMMLMSCVVMLVVIMMVIMVVMMVLSDRSAGKAAAGDLKEGWTVGGSLLIRITADKPQNWRRGGVFRKFINLDIFQS